MGWKMISWVLRPATRVLLVAAAIGGLASSSATAAEILDLNSTAASAEGEDYLDPFREMVLFEDYMLTITAAEAHLVRNGEYSANVHGFLPYLPGAKLLANAMTPVPATSEPIDGDAAGRGRVGYLGSWTNPDCSCRAEYGVTSFGFTQYAASFGGRLQQ